MTMNYPSLCLVTAVDIEYNAAVRLLADPAPGDEGGVRLCRGTRGARRVTVLKAGMGARGFAPRLAAHLDANPCDALLVAGLAGGLVPELAAGQVVLYDRCRDVRGSIARELEPGRDEIASIVEDDSFLKIVQALLQTAGLAVKRRAGITVGEIVVSAEKKLQLGVLHRAAAADMETFDIWAVCRDRKLPFAALRVISDEAGQDLPDFNRAYDREGRVIPHRMATAMAARPAVTARFLLNLRPVMQTFRRALQVVLDA
ncbi:MAG: hypothetical protein SF339_11345 [Blastocatellia bacterium]|nr:hypothetical protein [Blastocatellia bacterium]